MHRGLIAVTPFALLASFASAQVRPPFYDCLRWRMIGPYRGGRTVGATGVPGRPSAFYIGVNDGGVWKTDDYGRTWDPIFDSQPTGSIGAVAIAPSKPDTVYVGTGEGLQRPDLSVGDGVYKSTDAGKTWRHLGLRDGRQIAAIAVDPRDANKLFVAVLGHPYGPNQERGLYRSLDGGLSFQKVIDKGPDTGAVAVVIDHQNPNTVYADMWSARQGPWENGEWQGPNSGLYKSTDGGSTWKQLKQGLPSTAEGLGRIGIAVAPSDPNKLYATVDANAGGIYRSNDAGQTWVRVNSEERIWGRGSDFSEVEVDPKDPETIYVANTSMYKSTDGGNNFTCIKGSPGGDDYHTIWLNPDDPSIILLAGDQGAAVSVNGGRTWGSWFNQPTAQFYHVSTDNHFPYRVYGGQQESGSAYVSSRGNDGQVTFRDWHPVGAEEYGCVAPDPLHPNLVYGGKVTRYDLVTGQVMEVGPTERRGRGGSYRFLRTAPLMFSPVDPKTLYLAGNVVFKTVDGGINWHVISPDLTRKHADVPESIGVFRTPDMAAMKQRGVVYALGPSYLDPKILWAGTDDGLVQATRDGGKTWSDVTPPTLTAWSKVAQIDAGHFDADTAYVAVNKLRLDDLSPNIYKTHDGGKTWTKIVNGLPNDPVNTVREDPLCKGLLYAGTETAVYFSNDDGDHWNPLRLNMPATSIRDLVIHGDDLVVGTHGRSFWILDDITPLRQLGSEESRLYKPATAYRVHWNNNSDTPLPPEEPGGENPPDGAVLNYYLRTPVRDLTLEVFDSAGKLVTRITNHDVHPKIDGKNLTVMPEWIRPAQALEGGYGSHRFVWDLHYLGSDQPVRFVSMAAIWHKTSVASPGPWVMPGNYNVRLTADGQVTTVPLRVNMDPRVATSKAALMRQFEIAKGSYDAISEIRDAENSIRGRSQKDGSESDANLAPILDGDKTGPGLRQLQGVFGGLMQQADQADFEPPAALIERYRTARRALDQRLAQWKNIRA